MRQEQEHKKNYDKEDYLYKIDIGDIDYSRYLNALSDFDSTTYEPKRFKVYGFKFFKKLFSGNQNGHKRKISLDLMIDEEYSIIKVRNYNAKINKETLETVKRIISKYYSKNTSYRRRLFYNDREIFNIDELMNLLDDMKITDGYKLSEEYEAESLGVNTLNIEYSGEEEIQLHINSKEKKAYVKLPTFNGSLDLKFYVKDKLKKLGKDIIDKIGTDCEIYAINNAGEIYATLTLDQLLGKEEIQSDIVDKTYTANTDKYSFDHPIIQTNEMNNRMTVGIRPYTSSKKLDEILEQIEKDGEKYSSYIWYGKKGLYGEEFRKTGYFKKGLEELKKDIKELRDKVYLTEQQDENEILITDENEILIPIETNKDSKNFEIIDIIGIEYKKDIDSKILNSQNAIIIEKNSGRVDKYIYDAKTKEKVLEFSLANDKYNMYTPGTYVNIVEYEKNILTNLIDEYEGLQKITFITENQEELTPAETMERAFAYCSQGGGMSIGEEYTELFRNNGKEVQYADLDKMYSESATKSYNKEKTKLKKGLYMNKELIEEFFKTLKVRILVNENQDTTGIGQMGR